MTVRRFAPRASARCITLCRGLTAWANLTTAAPHIASPAGSISTPSRTPAGTEVPGMRTELSETRLLADGAARRLGFRASRCITEASRRWRRIDTGWCVRRMVAQERRQQRRCPDPSEPRAGRCGSPPRGELCAFSLVTADAVVVAEATGKVRTLPVASATTTASAVTSENDRALPAAANRTDPLAARGIRTSTLLAPFLSEPSAARTRPLSIRLQAPEPSL